MLKSIHKPTHLRNFAGQTLGVDAYGWLHRGTVSCAIELAQQKPTRKHLDFALSRVRMLIHFGVKPYLVFDGAYLPSKEHTEIERAAKRKESKKLGLELLNMGRIPQAYLELQKAIDVTPTMARELIEELKRMDVPYIVAPYEADSQLAYLEKQSIISGVISEDSDLLVFGVKCLLTKLDQYGESVMVNRADFTACREISLVGWTDKEFRMMAMLSGCDYLPGIDKMGLKTAYRLVRKHKAIERIIRSVQFEGKMKVPAGYLEAFSKAENTFLYQWVFCPEAHRVFNLNKLPAELENERMLYIGENVDPAIAVAIAAGDLDPNTKQPLVLSNTSRQNAVNRSRPVQTPDEKQGKPISEFFKPVRTPLAELDPNSFTPSPSQQILLQNQQGASWSASQVQTMRPPLLSRVAPVSGSSSAPQGTRRVHSEQWTKVGRKSPKRLRLCSDSLLAASMDGVVGLQSTSSRFFFKEEVEPSPSLRKPPVQRRKKDDFELWSDDSAAEAKKIEVYTEHIQGTPAETSPTADSSQDTVTISVPGVSQKTVDTETPLSSFEVEETRINQNVFSKGIDDDFAALKAMYTSRAASSRKKASRAKSMPLASRRPLQEAGLNQLLGRDPQVTSGEDIGAGEENANGETAAVPNSSPRACLPTAVRLESSNEDEIDDEERLEMEHREVSPAGSLAIRGSEEFLIPNSPESREGDEGNRPKLDLGRFAFAGVW